MKTIKTYKQNCVEIKLQMTTSKDADFFKGIYKVVEAPRKKSSEWKEDVQYSDNIQEAKEIMKQKILFWLK